MDAPRSTDAPRPTNAPPLVAPDQTKYYFVSGAHLLELARSASLRPWEFNRELDEERVARMFDAQRARLEGGRPADLFLPVPVTVCRHGGELLLMDGQHRLAVLRMLQARGLLDGAAVCLLLCEVPCASPGDVEDVFVRVNSGTPVPAAYYSRRVREVLGEFLGALAALYPAAVSAAPRPQRPNFNRARVCDEMSAQVPLRDALIDRRVTAEDLLRAAAEENAVEEAVSKVACRKLPESCLRRAEKSGFYLGLREGWAVAVALRAARAD